ncbi:hypothetical protein [Kocuria turfanensis]|uniref:Uncharacterized protein n=1 Tax=Kocuria turfanensis TaxID=388357 RepID=A0A512IG92_9MICC|nr:hypothetical protein [Kocuria turfanensis]GEO96670.1 hypothetical protein KTU01_27930 [Kocuria turfanensis]
MPMPEGEKHPDPSTAARATGVVTVGMCVAVWWPAFTLGAWGWFFFEQKLTVWAAATAALLIVLFRRHGEQNRKRRAAALMLPSVWLVLALTVEDDGGVLDALTGALGDTVAVLGLPATMWVLARIMWPDFGEGLLSPARRVLVIALVLSIAVASYLLGVHHAAFLTCADFTVSGNSEPPGCTPSAPGAVSGR